MIEDLQDDVIVSKKRSVPKSNKKGMYLVLFVVWVIFSAITILICKPKIDSALEETNAIEVFKNRRALNSLSAMQDVILYYVKFNDSDTYSLLPFSLTVRKTGESAYHDAVEGLLAEPDAKVLSSGSMNMIPKGTKLKGLTVSNGVAFVSFSKEYSDAGDSDRLAREQILFTLKQIEPSIYKLVILIDGKEV